MKLNAVKIFTVAAIALSLNVVCSDFAYADSIGAEASIIANSVASKAGDMADELNAERQFQIDRANDKENEQKQLDEINSKGVAIQSENGASVYDMTRSSLLINGEVIPFVQCDHELDYAMDVASTYVIGDGNVNDGEPTYFVGHNPGVFTPVMDLVEGDAVVVCDYNDYQRTYYVGEIVTVNYGDTSCQVENGLCYSGESISLQTCNNDGGTMRIVKCYS